MEKVQDLNEKAQQHLERCIKNDLDWWIWAIHKYFNDHPNRQYVFKGVVSDFPQQYLTSPLRAVMSSLGLCIICIPRWVYTGIVMYGESNFRESMTLIEFMHRLHGDNNVRQ